MLHVMLHRASRSAKLQAPHLGGREDDCSLDASCELELRAHVDGWRKHKLLNLCAFYAPVTFPAFCKAH
jgi:hypothetical protein